jgi:hypothetical protein
MLWLGVLSTNYRRSDAVPGRSAYANTGHSTRLANP